MSEDEIINILERITITSFNTNIIYDNVEKVNNAIQGLLGLYKKEKEKNKELVWKIEGKINSLNFSNADAAYFTIITLKKLLQEE